MGACRHVLGSAGYVNQGLRSRSYARPMDRDAWLLAARLLDRHGEVALDMVSMQLATLQRLVELKPNAEDVAMLRFWRETAHAMLTIFAARPAGPQSVN
jgi:hypothetical protein